PILGRRDRLSCAVARTRAAAGRALTDAGHDERPRAEHRRRRRTLSGLRTWVTLRYLTFRVRRGFAATRRVRVWIRLLRGFPRLSHRLVEQVGVQSRVVERVAAPPVRQCEFGGHPDVLL